MSAQYSPNTAWQPVNVEIHQKTGRDVLQAHISQQLCRMQRKEFLNGFDFNHQRVLDEKINGIAPGDLYPFVFEG